MYKLPTGQVAVLLACSCLLLTSCTTGRQTRATVGMPTTHRQIYALGDLYLPDALYYKPAGSTSDLDVYAAPLILQEVQPPGRIGRVRVDQNGRPAVETGTPVVNSYSGGLGPSVSPVTASAVRAETLHIIGAM